MAGRVRGSMIYGDGGERGGTGVVDWMALNITQPACLSGGWGSSYIVVNTGPCANVSAAWWHAGATGCSDLRAKDRSHLEENCVGSTSLCMPLHVKILASLHSHCCHLSLLPLYYSLVKSLNNIIWKPSDCGLVDVCLYMYVQEYVNAVFNRRRGCPLVYNIQCDSFHYKKTLQYRPMCFSSKSNDRLLMNLVKWSATRLRMVRLQSAIPARDARLPLKHAYL